MQENQLEKDPLTSRIIGCAYKVHSALGPGLNEKIYHNALRIAFDECGLHYEIEKLFKVFYQKQQVGSLRIDIVVEGKVIVEIKALEGSLPRIFESQILSYLKTSGCHTGLIINFGNNSCVVKRYRN
jgi:GxxExxY protein